MKGVEKKKGDQRWESEKKILKEIEAKIENMRKIYTDRQDKRYGLYWKKADKKLIWKRKKFERQEDMNRKGSHMEREIEQA